MLDLLSAGATLGAIRRSAQTYGFGSRKPTDTRCVAWLWEMFETRELLIYSSNAAPPCGGPTIIDATLSAAPPSTKNKDDKRSPEMQQSKKGNDWHFGLMAHVGVDAASGLVHTIISTAVNVADVTQAHALLHGDETAALGDASYCGVEKRSENIGKSVTWQCGHEALQTQGIAQE